MLHMAYATKIQGEDVLSECPKGNWPSSISHSIRWEWSPNTRLWMKSQHTADHRSDIRQILVWFQFFSLFFFKFAKYVTVRHLFAEHASILYNKVSFHTHSYFFSWSICSCSKSYYIHPLCVCVCVCVCVRLSMCMCSQVYTLVHTGSTYVHVCAYRCICTRMCLPMCICKSCTCMCVSMCV